MNCHFPIGILGLVWYLIVPIPDFCTLTYFESIIKSKTAKARDKSEITSEHEACGFGYQDVRFDSQAEKPVIYRDMDTVEVFLNHLDYEVNNINNIYAHPKPLTMTGQSKTFKTMKMLLNVGYVNKK